MKTTHLRVEVGQAGADAGQAAIRLARNGSHVHRSRRHALEIAKAGSGLSAFGKLEEFRFGRLDLLRGRKIDIGVDGVLDHVVADTDQLAPQMCLIDGDGVVCRLCKADDAVGKLAQIILDGAVRPVIGAAEETFQGDRVRQLPAVDHAHHGGEDAAMERIVEMFCTEAVVDLLHDVIVDKQRAKKVLLRRQVVRHLACGGETGRRIDGGRKGFDVG